LNSVAPRGESREWLSGKFDFSILPAKISTDALRKPTYQCVKGRTGRCPRQ
jgi:hypothetical protein